MPEKTRAEVLQQTYLTRSDVKKLLDVSYPIAVKGFNQAMEIDRAEMEFRIWETRVRLTSVLRAFGVSYGQLEKQIKSAAS